MLLRIYFYFIDVRLSMCKNVKKKNWLQHIWSLVINPGDLVFFPSPSHQVWFLYKDSLSLWSYFHSKTHLSEGPSSTSRRPLFDALFQMLLVWFLFYTLNVSAKLKCCKVQVLWHLGLKNMFPPWALTQNSGLHHSMLWLCINISQIWNSLVNRGLIL